MKTVTRKQFESAVSIVNKYQAQVRSELKNIESMTKGSSKFLNVSNETKLHNVDASVRLLNLLRAYLYNEGFEMRGYFNIIVGDLSCISLSEFMKCRNTGKKTNEELQELCLMAGVELKP